MEVVKIKLNKKQLENVKNNLEKYCKRLTEINVFRTNMNETPEHNRKISDLMIVHNLEGICVAIRPTLLNNNIPDLMILSFDEPVIKEVMKSEKDSRFEEKDYMGIRKIKVKVK